MPSVYSLQSVMNKGELTPKLHARVDSPYYRLGLKKCRNFYPLVQGGITKRSGTRYVAEALASGRTTMFGRLVPFVFSESQAYVLDFGDNRLGFLYRGGPVETSPGNRYTITTPYDITELEGLAFVQSADIVYLVHPNHPIHKLERYGETDWRLTKFTPKNGPWLDVNIKDNNALAQGLARPTISASSSASASEGSASSLLNKSPTSFLRVNTASFYVQYQLSSALVCNGYEVKGSNPGWSDPSRYVASYPRKWRFLGSTDGTNWDVLDSRVAEADWYVAEERAYYFENKTAYRYYRLDIEARNGDKDFTTIGSLRLSFENVPGTLNFENTENVNSGDGFTADDIGRQIRWQGDDGYWRIFDITGVVDSQNVSGKWNGFWLWNSDVKAKTWQLGAFSEYSGYPTTATIFQERLCFAGTKQQPRTVFMSTSGDYENFEIPDPLTDEAPITVTIAGAQQDRIEWLREAEQLLMVGTTDGIASLGGTEDAAVSATNIQQRKHTGFGTAPNIQPARVGAVLVFIGFHRTTVHELIYSAQNNGYDAPNMAVLADHIYAKKVNDIVFSQTPHDQVFMGLDDGTVASMTYERAQEVVGNAVFEFPGGKVKSIAVIPELGRDALYLLMERTIDGRSKQYVERLEKPFDYGMDGDAWFLDSALQYEGPQEDVLTGLGHLEGETVRVYGWDDSELPSGEPLPIFTEDYVVRNGQVDLTMPVTFAIVGLPFDAYAHTMPHVMDAADGTTLGRAKRVDAISVHLLNSRAIQVRAGHDENREYAPPEEVLLRGFSDNMDSYVPLFTGHKNVPIDDTWESDGELEIRSVEPQPATILAVTSQVDWEPGNSRRQGG